MSMLAVLVAGYLTSILVGRLSIRTQWIRSAIVVGIALLQVTIVVLMLLSKEPPNLERP